jgi:hypothetical protein
MNDNNSQQSIPETPIIKRGPGRPRGSKNRVAITPNTTTKSASADVGDSAVVVMAKRAYRTLPPMKLSEAEFVEEFRKTFKNTSIRPSEEQTGRLIYLDAVCHIPKAEAVKACLDMHLKGFYLETMANLHRLDAHDRGVS